MEEGERGRRGKREDRIRERGEGRERLRLCVRGVIRDARLSAATAGKALIDLLRLHRHPVCVSVCVCEGVCVSVCACR